MSYNGSGTFQINTSGQPVVTGTVISSSAFNALTADLATGLSTAITKDGQTATTVRIPFAQGINSSLTTDTSSGSTGSIYTAGGVGITKGLFVGGTATFSATPIFSALTASSAVATDASKNLVSVTNTGTGNNVLATSPTITTPTISSLTSAAATALTLQSAGTTAVTVDTSQNVGIGTTSPAAKLHVGPLNGSGSLNGYTKVAIEATDYAVLTLKCPAANTSQIIFTDTTSAGLGSINYYNSSNATPNAMAFVTASTERMRLNSTGALVLAGGSTSANGIGITFPATQSASTDANTLDDYEEGTWTPTVASASGSITSYSSSGQYIKIGSLVVLQFQYTITNNGTGSGSINISNLPFTGTTNTSAGAIREIAVNGFTGSVYLSGTTTLSASTYNSTYPGGTNYNVRGTVCYQAT
jgi:hypothetical protein